MNHTAVIAATFGALLISSPASAAGSDPLGIWLDDTGRGAIEIKPCGNNVCGYVVAVKNANDTKGCGKQIIGDAKPADGGSWGNGWIYSPEKRKNYDVELKPLSNGTLRVVGYAGTKLFSRTMIWTPAPADLKRCDSTENAAPSTNEAKAAPVEADGKSATAPIAEAAKTETTRSTTPDAKVEAPAGDVAESSPAKGADAEEGGEKPGERTADRRLKIGNLDLDKVLTRTQSGKCKLDLPWVKVQFECERE